MTEKTITLQGPLAFISLLIIGAFTVFQYSDRNRTLESEAVEELKTWILAEYMRELLPRMKEMVDHPAGREKEIGEMSRLLSRDNLQIISIEARGKGDDVAVRVEIEVDGKDPPVGGRIRYFRMNHSTMTGWSYESDIGKWGYYLTF